MHTRLSLALLLATAIFPPAALAIVYNATPSNYTSLMAGLRPGDTLNLAPGTYPRLYISGLRGTAAAWITVSGPASGAPAIITGNACCNTVEIFNSSYLAIQNLTIDSLGIDGVAGISAKDGSSNVTHDILIQNNILVGNNSSQQTDGISTKTPTWNWTIRRNTILGAGTGMYLGDSDGSSPFVAGVIENNLIKDTIGYNLQIKWQLPRPNVAGMPTGQSVTIIRDNVFIKNDQPSPDGDRPNVLVGGFPNSGPGSTDMYEVYGNFFYHNPREGLFQASGRVSVHDNIFVDAGSAAALFQNHDLPLKLAYVYNNTVYTASRGIYFGSTASTDHAVTGNLAFGSSPIGGAIANSSNNIVDTLANASQYVVAPSFTLGAMDFYPLAGKARGGVLDLSMFAADPDYAIDFNRVLKNSVAGAFVFRGAYAGEGVNPGWKLQAALKNSGATPAPSLTGLQCVPSSLSSGQQSNCTVSLSSAPSTPISVSLASNNPLVSVPASVTVGAGATSAPFTATAGTISSNGSALLTASLSGSSPVSTTLTLTAPAGGGALTGSVSAPSTSVNLTTEGTADWAHWGLATATSFDHKSGATGQIGNFTAVGGGAVNRYANNPASFTWTDGTPTASATSTPTGIYIAGQGMGFRITAPADTSVRTLKVYVGLWRSQGRMVAQLSDGSAAVYTDTSLNNSTGTTIGVYTFTYSAASAGQTLAVTYTQNNATAGNVTLQAATLVGGAPAPNFSITASPSSQTIVAGTNATSTVTVAALNGFTGSVGFSVSGMPSGVSAAFSPTTVSGSGTSALTLSTASTTTPGNYPLTITATSGALTRTTGFTLTVTPINGMLTGVLQAPAGPVALDTQGTLDWAHWGLNTAADFDHKAGVTPQISNFTALGGVANRFANNPVGFTWTGGTPTATATNSTTGLYIAGQNSGFRIVVPAGLATNTLRIYVGVWHAQGRMVAHLSDGSAVDYVDTSLNNSTVYGTAVGVYTLTYHAASNGQTLTLTFTQDTPAPGNVTLQAAALQ